MSDEHEASLEAENQRLRAEVEALRALVPAASTPDVPTQEREPATEPRQAYALLGGPDQPRPDFEHFIFDHLRSKAPQGDWRHERDASALPDGAIVYHWNDVIDRRFGDGEPPLRYGASVRDGEVVLYRVHDGELGARVRARIRALIDRQTWHIERMETIGPCYAFVWHSHACDVVSAMHKLIQTAFDCRDDDRCIRAIERPWPEEPAWTPDQLVPRPGDG
jgi:hypothetical protein